MALPDSILLLIIGQVVAVTVKHYADRAQVEEMKKQTLLLKEISDSHKG